MKRNEKEYGREKIPVGFENTPNGNQTRTGQKQYDPKHEISKSSLSGFYTLTGMAFFTRSLK
ncbi:MAG: hypothetical protein B6D35_14710 [Candidatus Brocadia sp. UTAMX2]|jgi:hypothetical protein|nr:MAG: hypothetical protein B6D35_14710 [Candidatus Brocadia sp. UTAMX2]